MPLPLVGQSQPVMREPLAQAAGMGEGEEGSPAGDTALQPGNPPPTVTTIAPPQGVPAGPAPVPAQPVATAPAQPVQPQPQPVAPAPKPVATQPAKPVAPAKPAPAPTQSPWPSRPPSLPRSQRPVAAATAAGTPDRNRAITWCRSRYQLRGFGPCVRQGPWWRLSLLQEKPAGQAAVRGHLRQLRQPRRSGCGNQELASEGPGW